MDKPNQFAPVGYENSKYKAGIKFHFFGLASRAKNNFIPGKNTTTCAGFGLDLYCFFSKRFKFPAGLALKPGCQGWFVVIIVAVQKGCEFFIITACITMKCTMASHEFKI